MQVDYGQSPPEVTFTETVAMFHADLSCGPDAHDYPVGHSDTVEFVYLGTEWNPMKWDEDGESFSYVYDNPEYEWLVGNYRFSRR